MVGRSVQVNSLCFTTDDDIKQYLLENISEEKFKELKEEAELSHHDKTQRFNSFCQTAG